MVDVCSFLNSRDVAEHLRAIGYEFSLPEAAFIVYHSLTATLAQKLAAWRELADGMPDCSMSERINMEAIPSFKRFLADYCALQERKLAHFRDGDGCVYRLTWHEKGLGRQKDDALFSTANGCLSYVAAEEWVHDDAISNLGVDRIRVDAASGEQPMTLCLNGDLEAVAVEGLGGIEGECPLDLQFDGMWFSIPVPFKRGDILRNAACRDAGPLVLDWLSTWGKDEHIANGFASNDPAVERADRILELNASKGDSVDMSFGAYWVEDDGSLRHDIGFCYLDLENARDGLSAKDRWAEVVSAKLKGEVDIVEATALLSFIEADNKARESRDFFERRYPDSYNPDGVWQRIRAIS